MRLISEALYNKLMNEGPTRTEQLSSEKLKLLSNPEIPIEMKPMLYHNTVRNLTSNIRQDKTNQGESSSLPQEVQRKKQMLDTWMEINGIEADEDGKLVMDGISHNTVLMKELKEQLLGINEKRKTLAGFPKIVEKLHKVGLPKTFFAVRQNGGCVRKKKTTDMRKKMKEVQFNWKPY